MQGSGFGIGLIAIGLVLALAVQDRINGVDTTLIGWILVGVGALALVVSLIATGMRSNTTHREEVVRTDDITGRRID